MSFLCFCMSHFGQMLHDTKFLLHETKWCIRYFSKFAANWIKIIQQQLINFKLSNLFSYEELEND